MSISELKSLSSNYTDFKETESSFEDAKQASKIKSDTFLDNFISLQQSGLGIDATGICAGFAVYVYKLLVDRAFNTPLPELPPRVPREVVHLEMQLPRAIAYVIPKHIDPETVRRGSSRENDRLIREIRGTFQRYIREESGVSVKQILTDVRPSQFRPFVTLLSPDHYLFCLHKRDQLVTEGHVIYADLRTGVIADARFGAFIWKIDENARKYFKKILIGHLNKTYSDWDLFACRLQLEPVTLYQKLPVVVRESRSRVNLIFNLGRKFSFQAAKETTYEILKQNPVSTKYAKWKRERKMKIEEFDNGLRNMEYEGYPIVVAIKKIEELAIRGEMFHSDESWGTHYSSYSPFGTTNVNAVNLKDDAWKEIFAAIESLDPRISGIKAQIFREIVNLGYWEFRNIFVSVEKFAELEKKYLPLFKMLIDKCKELKQKHLLNEHLVWLSMHTPEALKMLEYVLRQGADPNARCYFGKSALTLACESRAVETVALLLKYGAYSGFDTVALEKTLRDTSKNPEELDKIKTMLANYPPSLTKSISNWSFPCTYI